MKERTVLKHCAYVLIIVVTAIISLNCGIVFAEDTDTNLAITGDGWTYDDSAKTLTLNGYKSSGSGNENGINAVIYADGDLNVVLEGKNELKTTADYGIYCEGHLTIEGSGSLEIDNVSTGIYARKNLTVKNPSITSGTTDVVMTSYGGNFTMESGAIDAGKGSIETPNGEIIVENGTITLKTLTSYGHMTINGGTVTAGISSSNGIEINGGDVTSDTRITTGSYKLLKVTGGKLNAQAGIYSSYMNQSGGEVIAENPNESAIDAFSSVVVSGGKLRAIGTNGIDSTVNISGDADVYAEGTLGVGIGNTSGDQVISGGKVEAKGKTDGISSGWSNINITGGEVIASGEDYAIHCCGGTGSGTVSITGGTVTATGGKQALKGLEINITGSMKAGSNSSNASVDSKYYNEKYVYITHSETLVDDGHEVSLFMDGVSASSSSTGYTYDPETSTLTLNGYKSSGSGNENGINAVIYADGDLNVVLEGKNELKTTADYGIYCEGHLTIEGSGSLEIDNVSTGIYARKNLTVKNPSITSGTTDVVMTSYGGNFTMESGAIDAGKGSIETPNGEIIVENGTITLKTLTSYGHMTINGGTVTAGISSSNGIEINGGDVTSDTRITTGSYKLLKVTGGKLNAQAGIYSSYMNQSGGEVIAENPNESAIDAFSSVVVSGGKLRAIGTNGIDSTVNISGDADVYAEGTLGVGIGNTSGDQVISGGKVEAKGKTDGISSGWSNINITGGEVIASGEDYAIHCCGGTGSGTVSITGGTVTATGGKQALKGLEINITGSMKAGSNSSNASVDSKYYNEKYVYITHSETLVDDGHEVSLFMDGVSASSSSTGYTYDPETSTLTLNGYKSSGSGNENGINAVIYADGDLNVVLEGKNELKTTADYGIYCEGHLTIEGSGSLEIDNVSTGIYARKNLTVKNPSITSGTTDVVMTSYGGNFTMESGAIDAGKGSIETPNGEIIVENGTITLKTLTSYGHMTINGGTVTAGISSSNGIEINGGDVTSDTRITTGSYKLLKVTGGKLNAQAGIYSSYMNQSGGEVIAENPNESAIDAFSSVVVSGGKLRAIGTNGIDSTVNISGDADVYAEGTLGVGIGNTSGDQVISGGKVEAKGKTDGISSGWSNINITGGEVIASGEDYAIHCCGGTGSGTVSITGGTVTATGGKQALKGLEININNGLCLLTGANADNAKPASSYFAEVYLTIYSSYRFVWNDDYSRANIAFAIGGENELVYKADVKTEEIQKATCVTKGKTRYTANYGTLSESKDIEDIDIDPSNHTGNTILVNNVDPSCEKVGYTGDIQCVDCGKTIENGSEIQAVGHQWNQEYTVDKKETCTTEGSKSRHCIRCDKVTDVTPIAALGHDWDDGEITTEPTCTDEGVKTFTCSRCKETRTEAVEALGHAFAEEFTVDTDPTCTAEGSKSRHCIRCEEVTDVTPIAANGHTFGDWTDTTPSTCEGAGVHQHSCTVCGYTESEATDPKGHDVEENYTIDVPATCTTDGSRSNTCSRCDAIFDSEVITATGHNYGNWVITKEATCTENGSKQETCSRCRDKVTEEIPAKGHAWNDEPTIDKPATCTENGSQSTHCARCKETKDIEVIPALGHAWNKTPTVDKKPTCTADGSESIHCSRCDAIKDGSKSVIAKTGHKFSAWTTTKKTTELAAGQQTRKCSACGKTETKTIAQLKPTLPAVKITKPKAAKKSATVKWKKVSKANQKKIASIQIQYSLDKTFKTGVKTVTAKKTASSKKITKLTSKKTYYVRIRAYKSSGGVVHVSKWSTVKSVKAK